MTKAKCASPQKKKKKMIYVVSCVWFSGECHLFASGTDWSRGRRGRTFGGQNLEMVQRLITAN